MYEQSLLKFLLINCTWKKERFLEANDTPETVKRNYHPLKETTLSEQGVEFNKIIL